MHLSALAKGTVIDGRYEILSLRGQGGIGTVYKARQIGFERIVALKFLHTEALQDAESRERFRREGMALSSLNHSGFPIFYQFGFWREEIPFIAMEYLEGKSLRQDLNESGALAAKRVLSLSRQICSALRLAHEAGLVHRDLKPENIIIDNSDQAKICDFGLVKYMGENNSQYATLTETGLIVGSVHYLSPEQCQGKKPDGRADIYALGCMIFEMLAGSRPFDADTPVGIIYKHINDKPSALKPDTKIPAGFDYLIAKSLQKNPDMRYQSMTELLADLDLIESGKGKELSGKSKLLVKNLRKKGLLILALLAGLVFVATIYVSYKSTSSTSGNLELEKYSKQTKKTEGKGSEEELKKLARRLASQGRTAQAIKVNNELIVLLTKTGKEKEQIPIYLEQAKLYERVASPGQQISSYISASALALKDLDSDSALGYLDKARKAFPSDEDIIFPETLGSYYENRALALNLKWEKDLNEKYLLESQKCWRTAAANYRSCNRYSDELRARDNLALSFVCTNYLTALKLAKENSDYRNKLISLMGIKQSAESNSSAPNTEYLARYNPVSGQTAVRNIQNSEIETSAYFNELAFLGAYIQSGKSAEAAKSFRKARLLHNKVSAKARGLSMSQFFNGLETLVFPERYTAWHSKLYKLCQDAALADTDVYACWLLGAIENKNFVNKRKELTDLYHTLINKFFQSYLDGYIQTTDLSTDELLAFATQSNDANLANRFAERLKARTPTGESLVLAQFMMAKKLLWVEPKKALTLIKDNLVRLNADKKRPANDSTLLRLLLPHYRILFQASILDGQSEQAAQAARELSSLLSSVQTHMTLKDLYFLLTPTNESRTTDWTNKIAAACLHSNPTDLDIYATIAVFSKNHELARSTLARFIDAYNSNAISEIDNEDLFSLALSSCSQEIDKGLLTQFLKHYLNCCPEYASAVILRGESIGKAYCLDLFPDILKLPGNTPRLKLAKSLCRAKLLVRSDGHHALQTISECIKTCNSTNPDSLDNLIKLTALSIKTDCLLRRHTRAIESGDESLAQRIKTKMSRHIIDETAPVVRQTRDWDLLHQLSENLEHVGDKKNAALLQSEFNSVTEQSKLRLDSAR